MTFTINCARDIAGYRIEVTVKAEGTESIASVTTVYEDFPLATDFLSPPEVQYQRVFTQVGGWTPGVVRTVRITAVNQEGKQQCASRRWQD